MTEFEERTGFKTPEEAKAFYDGLNYACKHIRLGLTQAGIPTGRIDSMLDDFQDSENSYYACQIVGG